MSEIGAHTQKPQYPDWLHNDVARSGYSWIKIINPDAGIPEPFGPVVNYVGRLHFGKYEPDKQLIDKGSTGADEWWMLAGSRILACPWIKKWEGPNEKAVEDEAQARAFVDFELRRIEILHHHDLQSVSGVFSTGCPPLRLWAILGYMLPDTDYLALHQYGMKTMDLALPLNTWHLLRHRAVIRELRAANHQVPRLLITETGIDWGGDPVRDGWRAQGVTPRQYADQIIAYNTELANDPYVVAIFPFVMMHDGWPSFDIGSIVSGFLVEEIRRSGNASSLQKFLAAEVQKHIVPLVPGNALEKAAAQKDYLPAMDEKIVQFEGTTYVVQAFRHAEHREWQYIAHCIKGDWSNIHWFKHPN
jgi:hypothetical protein